MEKPFQVLLLPGWTRSLNLSLLLIPGERLSGSNIKSYGLQALHSGVVSTQGKYFCLMLGIPICTFNYFLDCILLRHSLMTWHKNPLFIFTLSDGSISKILKTIMKTKQKTIPKAVGLTLEGTPSFRSPSGRHTTIQRGLRPAPQEPEQGSP